MNFLYMEVANDVESQQKTWPEFEDKFPSLAGKIYGLDYDFNKTYRVCSLVIQEDEINWNKPTIEYYKAKNILDIMITLNE